MKQENPTIEICPGITRRTVAHGKTMYQMLATLAAGSRMPAHSHPQEQIVHILEGKMRLIVEGVPHELSTGDSFYLASNIPHGVETLSATRVICGTNTMVSDTMELTMPAPSAPEIAIASSTEGNA